MVAFHYAVLAWPVLLGVLASLLLLSALDDLVPSILCLARLFFGRHRWTPAPQIAAERRVAIFVPCWKESAVIGNMIRHNMAAVRYQRHDFFLGVYPNDPPTLEAVRELARIFRRVHLVVCPHPGPTSKADCLNWIFHGMVAYEQVQDQRFDTVVLHDAEDLIHPEALAVMNRERARYAMVQVPVLPLRTPISEVTHGVYCDDFAEFQTIDMPARQICRSFIPSNGVGTAFAREILDRLALERANVVFHPGSLTEDYEIGVYIHNAGYSQLFYPIQRLMSGEGPRDFCATREYFPRRVKSAIRQRTRWVTGICLQSWARDGWRGSWHTKYWFWRDRKGLLANPISFFTNLLFLLGVCDWVAGRAEHRPWMFAVSNTAVLHLCVASSCIQVLRLGLRSFYSGRMYGFGFGLAAPLRAIHGNVINCFASFGALWHYLQFRRHKRPLVWLKTDHAYPGRDTVVPATSQGLADVLVNSAYVAASAMEEIQMELGSDTFLGELLVARGVLREEDLCSALSLQSGVPFTEVDARGINTLVARTLPRKLARRLGVVPFRLHAGRLCVAGARIPSAQMYEECKQVTPLAVEFHLVTRRNFDELRALL